MTMLAEDYDFVIGGDPDRINPLAFLVAEELTAV